MPVSRGRPPRQSPPDLSPRAPAAPAGAGEITYQYVYPIPRESLDVLINCIRGLPPRQNPPNLSPRAPASAAETGEITNEYIFRYIDPRPKYSRHSHVNSAHTFPAGALVSRSWTANMSHFLSNGPSCPGRDFPSCKKGTPCQSSLQQYHPDAVPD